MEERLNINIGIIGCVSAGKTTLLNSLLLDNYSNMNIKRCTLVPHVYHEYFKKTQFKTAIEINKESSNKNEELLTKLEASSDYSLKQEDCTEIQFHIPKIKDIQFMKQTIDYTIYDVPGLNDGRTKQVYYDYLRTIFNKFDIILYVLDINSGLNTSDEMSVLKFLMNRAQHYKEQKTIQIIPIINKCDDMSMDSGKLKCKSGLMPNYDQIINTINDHKKKYGLEESVSEPIPLSLKYSYIYRMISSNPDFELSEEDKYSLGFNEMGKRFDRLGHQEQHDEIKRIVNNKEFISEMIDLTGFNQLIATIKDILTIENQYLFCYEKINNSIDSIMKTVVTKDNIISLSQDFVTSYKLNIRLNKIFDDYEKNSIQIKSSLTKLYSNYKLTVDKKNLDNIYEMKGIMEKLMPIVSEYCPIVKTDYENIKYDVYSYYESDYQKEWNLEELLAIVSKFYDNELSLEQINKYAKEYILEYINKNINVFRLGVDYSDIEIQYNYIINELIKFSIDKYIIILLVKHLIIIKVSNLINDYNATKDAEKLKMLFESFVYFHHFSTKNLLISELYSYIFFNVLGIDRTLLTDSRMYQYSDNSSNLDKILLSLL